MSKELTFQVVDRPQVSTGRPRGQEYDELAALLRTGEAVLVAGAARSTIQKAMALRGLTGLKTHVTMDGLVIWVG